MAVGTQVPSQRANDDLTGLLQRFGEELLRGQSRLDAKLDRLENNVAGLKTDVAGLKTDVAELKAGQAETNARLDHMTLAHEHRNDLVDTKLDKLNGLIMRDERRGR